MQFIIGPPLSGVQLYAERLTVVLGFATLFFGVASFASCRSCLSFLGRVGIKNLADKKWFRPFYNVHGYFWYGFILLLVIHTIAAIMHTALPSAKDLDGLIHLIILGFGVLAFILVVLVFSSCRSLVSFLTTFSTTGPMENKGYRSFYRFHALFWGLLFAAIAGHIIADYFHIGFWPV